MPEGLCFYVITETGVVELAHAVELANNISWDSVRAYKVSGTIMGGYEL